jgi:hypothetical protein
MTTEKDSIRFILERRGIINNGKFDAVRFQKLVTEPWIRAKTIKYGFDKLNETNTQVVDNKPVIEEVVEIQEPITVVEEPVVEEPVVAEEVVETSTESVLLEEDLKEEVVETQSETVEEPAVEEVVAEEPAVEIPSEEPVVEEVVETPKKKTSKKK